MWVSTGCFFISPHAGQTRRCWRHWRNQKIKSSQFLRLVHVGVGAVMAWPDAGEISFSKVFIICEVPLTWKVTVMDHCCLESVVHTFTASTNILYLILLWNQTQVSMFHITGLQETRPLGGSNSHMLRPHTELRSLVLCAESQAAEGRGGIWWSYWALTETSTTPEFVKHVRKKFTSKEWLRRKITKTKTLFIIHHRASAPDREDHC